MYAGCRIPPIPMDERFEYYKDGMKLDSNAGYFGPLAILMNEAVQHKILFFEQGFHWMSRTDLLNTMEGLIARDRTVSIQLWWADRNMMRNRETMQQLINEAKELGYIQNMFISSAMASKQVHIQVFYNTNTRTLICMTDSPQSAMTFHKMLAFVPTVLDLKGPNINDEIIELCSQIIKEDLDKLTTRYERWYEANQDKFRRERYSQVKGAFKGLQTDRLSKIKADIDKCSSNLESLMASYTSEIRTKKALEDVYILEAMSQEGDSAVLEFIDYMQQYKDDNIMTLTAKENNTLVLQLKAPVMYHFREDLEQLLKSERLPVFSGNKTLLETCFLSDRFRTWMCATFTADLKNCKVTGIRQDGEFVNNIMLNRHIAKHNCMGGYAVKIQKAIIEKNYIMMLELLIACTGSITWGDSTVAHRTIETMAATQDGYAFIEDTTTNEFITIAEAVRRNEREKNAGES